MSFLGLLRKSGARLRLLNAGLVGGDVPWVASMIVPGVLQQSWVR